jgi:chromosome partitioning protein
VDRTSTFFRRLTRWTTPEQPRPASGSSQASAKVLAITAHKGGVGKTTTSVNLGAALARYQGVRVLIVDLDPQGHVSACLGNMLAGSGAPLSSALAAGAEPADMARTVTRTLVPGLAVTGWDSNLQTLESTLATRADYEHTLVRALEGVRYDFDLIIIDCPPSLGPLTQCAFAAADFALVPCDVSPLAIRGVDSVIASIYGLAERLNGALDVIGIVMTRVDSRTHRMNEDILDALHQRHGTLVLDTTIPMLSSFVKAQHKGVDIHDHEPGGKAATAYVALAEEIRPDLRLPVRAAARVALA